MGRRDKAVLTDQDPALGLGAALRRARQSHGLTLTALASRLGYTKGHISAVETGAVWPTIELLQAYESMLSLAAGELTELARGLIPVRRRKPAGGTHGRAVGELLTQARRGVGSANWAAGCGGGTARATQPPPTRAQAVIRGVEELLRWPTELVEEAALRPAPPGGEIIFTFRGRADAFAVAPDLWHRWRRALRAALERGWNVVELCPFDGDEEKQLALVAEMLPMLGFAGHYQPMCLPRSESASAGYDFLIVPGVGALLFFATRPEQFLDAGFFYSDQEYVAVLREHVELLRSQAMPILKVYKRPSPSPDGRVPYPDLFRVDIARTQAFLRPGDHFAVKDGLGTLLLPPAQFRERGRQFIQARGDGWSDWVRVLTENRSLQVAAFYQQVKNWRFRDICTRRAIDRLVTGESYVVDHWLQQPPVSTAHLAFDAVAIPARPTDRVGELQAIIDTLRSCPGYELGLLDDSLAGSDAESFWQVKGRIGDGVLFLDTWYPLDERRLEMNLEITQTVVVEAFRGYFDNLWQRIPTHDRNKEAVIAWLGEQIRRIPVAQP